MAQLEPKLERESLFLSEFALRLQWSRRPLSIYVKMLNQWLVYFTGEGLLDLDLV